MTRRAVLGGALTFAGCTRKPDLPVLATVPEFVLTSQSGDAFATKILHGKPWLASFFFSTCATHCPRINAALFQVQEKTYRHTGFRLVSFTVDPVRDTPAALATIAKRYKADPARWTFLTGEPAALSRVSREGFLSGDIAMEHSLRIFLVDGEMKFRAIFHLDDGIGPILKGIETLYGTA